MMDESYWGKTDQLIQRVKDEYYKAYKGPDELSRYGYFHGLRIIGRDVAINDGVYPGTTGEREAVVVDDKKPESILSSVYSELVKNIRADDRFVVNGQVNEEAVLHEVSRVTLLKMKATDETDLLNEEMNIQGDQLVDLDVYVKAGMGLCVHHALLNGYLIERLIRNGILKGTVSVDRNATDEVGHAWVRYTDKEGKVTIVDTASDFVGGLKDEDVSWPYERPEDKTM